MDNARRLTVALARRPYFPMKIIDEPLIHKRVFIGGLPATIASDDISSRFGSFGTVSTISVVKNAAVADVQPACRGFAYVDLETTEADWKRCISAYNGSIWHGNRLRIEEAKPDYLTRLRAEQTATATVTKSARPLIRHAKDMSLVTDKNAASDFRSKNWRYGRYGRAISIMKLKRPDRSVFVYDPSHYKNNLEKLFGSVRPKPVTELTWRIDEDKTEDYSSDTNDNEVVFEDRNEKESKVNLMEKIERSSDQIQATEQHQEIQTSIEATHTLQPTRSHAWTELTNAPAFRFSPAALETAGPAPHGAPLASQESILTSGSATATPAFEEPDDFDYSSILFDFGAHFSTAHSESRMPFRPSSREEALAEWRAARSELRRDFRARRKQAIRLLKRKGRSVDIVRK